MRWDRHLNPEQVNRMLNNRGPLYLVEYGKKEYLVIPRDAEKEGKGWWVLDEDGDLFHEYKFMKKLGVDIIGLGFDQLLNIFFDENETINKSDLTESQKKYLSNLNLEMFSKILNLFMRSNYSWWKEIKIDKFDYIGKKVYHLHGTLKVDEEWLNKQLYIFRNHPMDLNELTLGDIIYPDLGDELTSDIISVMNSTIKNEKNAKTNLILPFRYLKVIPE
jgi:hypothetical protein